MLRFRKSSIKVLVLLFAVASLGSCGSAGDSNDQGITFTLLGFFGALPDDSCGDTPAGLIGISTPISNEGDDPESLAGEISGAVPAVLGVQNNLAAQFVRTDRVFLTYFIPGANAQPPSTSVPFGGLLGAAEDTSGDSGGDSGSGGTTSTSPEFPPQSSLPPGFIGGDSCNRFFGEFPVVPAEVMTWINLNRGQLPEAPFTMEVEAVVSGVTSSGDRLETNSSVIFVQFTPDNIIEPSGGSDTGEDDEEEVVPE